MHEDVPQSVAEIESTLRDLKLQRNVERIATISHGSRSWPMLSVRSAGWLATKPTILISGGVHGDEPAGVHAALSFLSAVPQDLANDLQFIVFPCVNPSGFEAHTLATETGANLNRLFGVDSTQPEVRAIEGWLSAHARRFLMTFDLHEVRPDYVGEGFVEADNPKGAYLYETVIDDSTRIGRSMIDALPPDRPVCDWPTIYHDINENGVVSYPEGCRNAIYAEGTSLDSFLSGRYTGHSFTLETPTGWDLSDRVATHLTFLRTALSHAVSRAMVDRDSPSR